MPSSSFRRALARPGLMLEEVASLPRYRLKTASVELLVFVALMLGFEVWALAQPARWPVIFVPFLLLRLVKMGLSISEISCSRPWGPLTLATANSGLYFLPQLLRIVDGGAIVLCLLMSLFALLTMQMSAGVTPAGQFSFVTAFFPLWLGTSIEVALVILVLVAACLGGVTIPPDPFAGRRPFGRPYGQQIVFTLFPRVVSILLNMTTVPLALVLQGSGGLTWTPFFLAVAAVLGFSAGVPLLVLISALAQDKLIPEETRTGPALLYSKPRRQVARQLLALISIITVMLLATIFVADAQQRRIMSGNVDPDGANPMAAPLTLALLSTATFAVGCFVTFVSVIPSWRLAFAAALGTLTPDSAELTSLQAAMRRTVETMIEEQRQRTEIIGRSRLPFPTQLVKLGYHRFRRVADGDDLDALSKQAAPPPVTPLGAGGKIDSPFVGQAGQEGFGTGILASPPPREPSRQDDDSQSKERLLFPVLKERPKTTKASSSSVKLTLAAAEETAAGIRRCQSASCLQDLSRTRAKIAASVMLQKADDKEQAPAQAREKRPSPKPVAASSLSRNPNLYRGARPSPLSPRSPNDNQGSAPISITPAVGIRAPAVAAAGADDTLRRQALMRRGQQEEKKRARRERQLQVSLPPPRNDEGSPQALAAPVAASLAPKAPSLTPRSSFSPGSADLCRVCFDQIARACLLECGDGGLCLSCATKILAVSEPGFARCPFCRRLIDHVATLKDPPSQHLSMLVETVLPSDSDDDDEQGSGRSALASSGGAGAAALASPARPRRASAGLVLEAGIGVGTALASRRTPSTASIAAAAAASAAPASNSNTATSAPPSTLPLTSP